jgi:hypothetical protein
MAIDDPIEKIKEGLKPDSFDGIGTALQVGGLAPVIFKVFSVAKSISDSIRKGQTATITIVALCDELQRMQENLPRDWERALDSD